MSERKNLRADRGFTFELNLDFNDADGNAIDLTGHTVVFELKQKNGTVVHTENAAVGVGTINLKVTDEETAIWPTAPLTYNLVHNEPDGDKYRLLTGDFTVVS